MTDRHCLTIVDEATSPQSSATVNGPLVLTVSTSSQGLRLAWQESGVDMAWNCTGFGPLCGAVFRSGAAAAFSPRLQPGVEAENMIHQP